MSTRNRPLSPHLDIYRLPLLAIMSITHRITGVGLVIGLFALTWWLCAAANGPEYFSFVQAVFGSFLGKLFLFGWTLALFFHLSHGIRHLLWDSGWGFEIPQAYLSAKVALVAAVALTVIAWIIGLA
ncbi:succinate dehydrogenase, cytochrome b556 subunit [Magnetospirillum sulfuroxidans]|uniref:Succinate dehydrogenase cytochrome b556 subunit n=1 Tax=Magnetospirillum sulfuroxidans TaxID=611300 RepID=A0ABS5ICK1_9PROT|nr:succinate dehydrogenase, cytochrome b556 subunit [Magnetospirillum sulfuroxidans]MBR9972016.1 succinate dehydrogenase, cytochrome b556 subunit [Magnetospirillum sulfuroxidans]